MAPQPDVRMRLQAALAERYTIEHGARPRGHGYGLSRARREARPRGRPQGPEARLGRRHRTGPLPPRDHDHCPARRGWTFALWQGRLDTLRAVLARLPADGELDAFGSALAQRAQLLYWERRADSLLQPMTNASLAAFDARTSSYRPRCTPAGHTSCAATGRQRARPSKQRWSCWTASCKCCPTTGGCTRLAAGRSPAWAVAMRPCVKPAGFSNRSCTKTLLTG